MMMTPFSVTNPSPMKPLMMPRKASEAETVERKSDATEPTTPDASSRKDRKSVV